MDSTPPRCLKTRQGGAGSWWAPCSVFDVSQATPSSCSKDTLASLARLPGGTGMLGQWRGSRLPWWSTPLTSHCYSYIPPCHLPPERPVCLTGPRLPATSLHLNKVPWFYPKVLPCGWKPTLPNVPPSRDCCSRFPTGLPHSQPPALWSLGCTEEPSVLGTAPDRARAAPPTLARSSRPDLPPSQKPQKPCRREAVSPKRKLPTALS